MDWVGGVACGVRWQRRADCWLALVAFATVAVFCRVLDDARPPLVWRRRAKGLKRAHSLHIHTYTHIRPPPTHPPARRRYTCVVMFVDVRLVLFRRVHISISSRCARKKRDTGDSSKHIYIQSVLNILGNNYYWL